MITSKARGAAAALTDIQRDLLDPGCAAAGHDLIAELDARQMVARRYQSACDRVCQELADVERCGELLDRGAIGHVVPVRTLRIAHIGSRPDLELDAIDRRPADLSAERREVEAVGP